MAKAPIRARKRVRKQVSDGVAHIHASLTTQLLLLLIVKVMHWVGQPQVVLVFVVLVSLLRLPLKLQQNAVLRQ